MRRAGASRREILPDPKHGSRLVAKFVNMMMYGGKKSTAERIMYDALQAMEDRARQDSLKLFKSAVDNCKPAVEVKSRRVGGSTYQVPVEVRPDRRTALSELARVTQPGGVVAVLELGEPRVGWLSPLARAHVHKTLPRLGAWLSGSDAYVYLQESIAAFPEPDAFALLMQEAGLEPPAIDRLSFGAAHLFVSRVPLTPARA